MKHAMDMTTVELAENIRNGVLTPVDAVSACFERIEALNPKINAFVYLCKNRAFEEARAQTEALKKGVVVGPLCGVPFGVKDLEDAAGLPTSYGCTVFGPGEPKEIIPAEDSVQVMRLRQAGAIVVGKTNVPIFGSTIFTKNRVHGTSRNPWNMNLTPGGSSGGSSAAVAAKMVPFATGADGGGSIRNPACFTGCFGLKPTRGLVPMTECRSFGMERFVHCVCFGPLTRTVEDTALLLDITAGYHWHDPMSIPKPPTSFLKTVQGQKPRKKLRILFSSDFGYVSHVDRDILEATKKAVLRLESFGHTVVVESFGKANLSVLPDLELGWAMAMGVQEREMAIGAIGEDSMHKLDKGMQMAWSYYENMKVSELAAVFRDVQKLNTSIDKIFESFDVLASPTMPVRAFNAEGPVPIQAFSNPLHVVGFLTPFNFSGHPAASVRLPSDNTQPIGGLQFIGPRHSDDVILELCSLYESTLNATFPIPKL